MSATQPRPAGATFDTRRFCPYHGGFVLLSECPILATSRAFELHDGRVTSSASAGSSANFDQVLGGITAEDMPPAAVAPPPIPEPSGAAGEAMPVRMDLQSARRRGWIVGKPVASRIDGMPRVVVAMPPRRPTAERRRRFSVGPTSAPPLPSAAELARAFGGARARPVRACPVCEHPLPGSIDLRDPFSVALVGHTHASKTTLVAALMHQLSLAGPEAIGASGFSATESTARMLAGVLDRYRRRLGTDGTRPDQFHRPLEFHAEFASGAPPATVILHDVAGEDLENPDQRLKWAPYVLWADAIVFVYNPEDSPRAKAGSTSEKVVNDQGVLLHGVFGDLEERPEVDSNGDDSAIPPLVVAVSKADLLPNAPDLRNGPAPDAAVQEALRAAGDGEVVSAARRWPEAHWRFIAPHPPGGEPQGVLELFSLVLSLLDR
ncbi:MAG TPA: hypothetical protein VKB25_15930 [Conexibacter sp.]|nr:hypothetical protein [Conexibacter sp.]